VAKQQVFNRPGFNPVMPDTDLHRSYVSCVERGIRNPTVLIVAKLANSLGVDPAKLLESNG